MWGIVTITIPSKKKRQQKLEKSLEKAKETKKKRRTEAGSTALATEITTVTIADDGGEPSGLSQLMTISDGALGTEDEQKVPAFDLDSSLKRISTTSLTPFVKIERPILTEMIESPLGCFPTPS